MNANIDDPPGEIDTVRLLDEVRRASKARLALEVGPMARLVLVMPIAFGALALAWLTPFEAPAIAKFMLIIGSCGAMAALIEIWLMRSRLDAAIELVKLFEVELKMRTAASHSDFP